MTIARAAFANYARLAVTAASQVALVPVMVNHLGTDTYGLYSLVISAVSFFSLLEFGAGVGALRAVAADSQNDRQRRNAALSTMLVLSTGLAAGALLLLLALAPHTPSVLRIPDPQRHEAYALLVLLGLRSAVLPWPLGIFRGALIGRGDIGLANAIQGTSVALYAVAAILLLPRGLGVVGVGWLSLAAFLVEHAAYVFFAFRRLPGLSVSPRLFDRRELAAAVSLGGAQTLVSLAGLLLLRTDPLIVGWRMPLEAVAAYAVALRVAEQAFMLVKQFVNALPPFIARLEGSGDRAALGRLLVLGVRTSLVPAVVVALPLAAFSTKLLTVWVGPSIATAGPALAVLGVATALMAPQMVISSLFTYTGRHALTGRIAILSAVMNIVASVALVGPLGLTGVSLGTLAAVVVVDVAFAGRLAVQCFNVTPRALWIEGFGRALFPALPAILVAVIARQTYPLDSIWQLAGASALVGATYLAGFWFGGIPREHRSAITTQWLSRRRLLGVPANS